MLDSHKFLSTKANARSEIIHISTYISSLSLYSKQWNHIRIDASHCAWELRVVRLEIRICLRLDTVISSRSVSTNESQKQTVRKNLNTPTGTQTHTYPHTHREREKGRTKLSVSALTSASGAGSSYGSGSRRQSLKSWPDVATRHLFNDGSHLPRPRCGNATPTPPPCQPVSPRPPQRSHMRRAVGHKRRVPS